MKPPSMLITNMIQPKRMSNHSTASCFVILYILCVVKDVVYLHPNISQEFFSTRMRWCAVVLARLFGI